MIQIKHIHITAKTNSLEIMSHDFTIKKHLTHEKRYKAVKTFKIMKTRSNKPS
ncbi:hypothetical protein HanIR_Chr09g0442761 [Helianthus annuus]|nr:hypothetical protein HanIR_Chr09g0442761 [Helianthus annuus]